MLGELMDIPVLAATKIYEGALVAVDANGYAKNLAGTDPIFAGIAYQQADNSAGASGAIKVRVRRTIDGGCPLILVAPVASATLANVGDTVYASDENTLTLVSTSNKAVGVLSAFESASRCHVKLDPAL